MKLREFFDDDSIEREFVERGMECCTRTLPMGHRCGYVALREGHPLFGKDVCQVWDSEHDPDVDGGVTFADGAGDLWVLGWDAAHSWHIPDPDITSADFAEIYARYGHHHEPFAHIITADMAEDETRRLARQLAEVVA